MSFVTFILGVVGPVIGRVLAALGMSVVTIAGVEAAIGGLKNHVIAAAQGLPAQALSLFLIAGGGVGIGMIFAAITFRLTYWSITKAVSVVGVSS